ncbi:MAG: regulatory protein RecX [Adlercreutzia equolifaciens]
MQVAAWPCPAEDDAVCGRDAGTSCAQDLVRSSRGEERESALSDEEGKTARDAYQKILRWAAVRERSTAYLRERLLKDDFPAAVVEEALQRALRVQAVDDRRYADALVRMKLAAGRGLRDAEREIEELGIDPATLDSWVEHERKGRTSKWAAPWPPCGIGRLRPSAPGRPPSAASYPKDFPPTSPLPPLARGPRSKSAA